MYPWFGIIALEVQKTTWVSFIVLSLLINNLVFYKLEKNRENGEKGLRPVRINCTASVVNLSLFKRVQKRKPLKQNETRWNLVKIPESAGRIIGKALISALQG